MSPDSFVLSNPNGPSAAGPEFLDYLGHKAVYLPSGMISVKNSKLRDGTIDVDVATKQGALFTGIAFRIESDAKVPRYAQKSSARLGSGMVFTG